MFYRKTVLDNGITVISEYMESVRSVTLGIWFAVGSRDETPEEAGMSHFMEHMMFKGTPTRSAKDISEEFDRMGAEFNAGTSKEYTVYYARFLDQHLPLAFEILGDMVVNASCLQEECEKERKVVLEEIGRMEDNPEDHVGDVFESALMPQHPLGLPVIGRRETVETFGNAEANAFRDKHFVTGNVVVAAAGNVDHDDLVALVEAHLAGLPEGPRTERESIEPIGQKSHASLWDDTKQAHILYGTIGISAADEDRFALQLLSDIVGGGMSSRLFHKIREQHGLAYAVQAFPLMHQDTGGFAVYVGTHPDNAQRVIGMIREEFADVIANGVTDDELNRVRESSSGHLVLSTEATRTRMMRLGRSEIGGLEILSTDEAIDRYERVTHEDISRVAARVLDSPATLAVIGPFDAEQVAALTD
ncbi:MAG: insulinase family protein [Coriobacteriia bacterium]|nr:insulinase family protein [Coriobacteriia bacterium]